MLWGKQSLLSYVFVFVFVINAFVTCMRETSKIFIDTAGLFWFIRWKTIVEALLNIVLSWILGHSMNLGIEGVILGTLISNLTTNFWWEPFVVHKYYFDKPLSKYYLDYCKYFVCFCLSYLLSGYFVQIFNENLFGLILGFLTSIFSCSVFFVLLFYNTDEFRYYLTLFSNILKKLSKKSL